MKLSIYGDIEEAKRKRNETEKLREDTISEELLPYVVEEKKRDGYFFSLLQEKIHILVVRVLFLEWSEKKKAIFS